jgi:GINS complex subunit 1
MNYCQKGRELLMDLKRSDFLPTYDEEGIRLILNELVDLYGRMETIVQEAGGYTDSLPDSSKVTVTYYHACISRNRRYINCYLSHRIGKIRVLRWETGAVLPDRINTETLSPREVDYFSEYDRIVSEYCESVGLDLTSDIEPPKELFIQVRVVKNSGEIMTDNGPVDLREVGSSHFLRRADVEHLIRNGSLEHVHVDDC